MSCTNKLRRGNLLKQGKTCYKAACGDGVSVLSTFPALATVVLSRFADVPQVCHVEAETNLCCYCIFVRLLLAKTSPSISDPDWALLPSKDDRGLSLLPSKRLAAKSVLGCKSLRGAHGFEWMHRHVAPKQSVESGQNLLRRLAAKSVPGCTVIARRDCFVVPPRNDSRRSNLLNQGKTCFEAACS